MEHEKKLEIAEKRIANRFVQRFKDEKKYDIDMAFDLITKLGKSFNPKFEIDEKNRFAYENIIYWLNVNDQMKANEFVEKNDEEKVIEISGNCNKGIGLFGNSGSGKTTALQIINEIAIMYDKSFMQFGEPFKIKICPIRAPYLKFEFTSNGYEAIKKYISDHSLTISDLGEELKDDKEMKHYGTSANIVAEIIEERYLRNLMTHIETNYTMKELLKFYGYRVYSRLKEMCNFIVMEGKDRRK